MKRQAIFGAACLAFGGCFKEKREVTLNPDGSGKMAYEYRGPMQMMQLNGENKSTPQEQARKEVKRILSESEGVSAWKDLLGRPVK